VHQKKSTSLKQDRDDQAAQEERTDFNSINKIGQQSIYLSSVTILVLLWVRSNRRG
jgi:hypothetical protein